jgi:ABC-type multidrug transport system fused ATPase/permease subunit
MRTLRDLRERFTLLTPALRRRWLLLAPLSITAALIEAVAAAAVFALVALLGARGDLSTVPFLSAVLARLPGEGTLAPVLWFTALVAAFYLARMVFLLGVTQVRSRLAAATLTDLSTRVLAMYLAAPYAFHLRNNSADLIERARAAAAAIPDNVLTSAFALITEVLVMLGILAVLMAAAPWTTLVTIGLLAVVVVAVLRFTRAAIVRIGMQAHALDTLGLKHLQQALAAAKEVRVLGREAYLQDVYEKTQVELAELRKQHAVLNDVPRQVIESTFAVAMLVIIGLVAVTVTDEAQVLPVLGLFAYAGFRVLPSLHRIVLHTNGVRFGLAMSTNLLHDVRALGGGAGEPLAARATVRGRDDATVSSGAVREETTARGRGGTARQAAHPGDATNGDVLAHAGSARAGESMRLRERLSCESVSFTYEGWSAPVLRDVDLTIHRGEAFAIVGPSGAGKSTLVDLLLGLLVPTSGRVRVDGTDIHDDLPAWRACLGYVPQEIFLTDDTIRRNVAFAIPDDRIDDAAVRMAVRLARLDRMIASLPDGLDTLVGERGVRLSGGERQRVAIARALYHQPDVILFDEATANLDIATEREIMDDLEALAGERTLILVSHRPETVERCDRLVLLRAGRIEATGTYEKLKPQIEASDSTAVTGMAVPPTESFGR